MKILFVCMQYIHSARWINQLKDTHHEIFLFDCMDRPIHKDLLWTNYTTNWSKRKINPVRGEYFLEKKTPIFYKKIVHFFKVTASERLEELIKEIQPDLVHSLEMQTETYPLLKVRNKLQFNWTFSCWGNDIFYYKDKKFHNRKIKKNIDKIDYFFLECKRDEKLIKAIKPNANVLGTKFPGGGGYPVEEYSKFIKNVADRNLIIIKGYQHNFGRCLFVLNALVLILDKIKNYTIYVYSAHDIVVDKIKELNVKHNLNIQYTSRYSNLRITKFL